MGLSKEPFIRFLYSMLNVPYIWGGQSFNGVDCSGFAQLALQTVGLDPKGDQTAQTLYNTFVNDSYKRMYPELGTLIFHGHTVNNITHIRIALDDHFCIEAGGGDSTTKTLDDAIKKNACVRIRTIESRNFDQIASLTPLYPWI